ncbi:MAG: hypothetical protein KAW89_08195, partial [Armatimonadetes bacterium]|nr:hypothetical protein [Armatimonadota bacterium]
SYGCIIGTVMPEATWPTALVSVVPVGGTAPVARGSVNPEDGSFRACLPAGDYYLVVTAVGYETHDSSALVPAVTYAVAIGSEVDAGAIVLEPVVEP